MNKIYNPEKDSWSTLLSRPTQTVEDIEATVLEIFNEVKQKGDVAIEKYTNLFDGIELKNIQVSATEISEKGKTIEADASKD